MTAQRRSQEPKAATSFKKWLELGQVVKKGEKALLLWGTPRQTPNQEKTKDEEADEFIAAVDLPSFDQHLARIERLDAMIDRTIKRLIQLKSMKQEFMGSVGFVAQRVDVVHAGDS